MVPVGFRRPENRSVPVATWIDNVVQKYDGQKCVRANDLNLVS